MIDPLIAIRKASRCPVNKDGRWSCLPDLPLLVRVFTVNERRYRVMGASQDFHGIELLERSSDIADEFLDAVRSQIPILDLIELLDRVSVSIGCAMRKFRIFIGNKFKFA